MKTIVHSAKVFNDGVIEAEVKTKTSLGMGVHVTGLSGTEIINGVRRLILTLTTLSDITIKPGRQLSVHIVPENLNSSAQFFQLPIALGLMAATHRLRTDELDNFLVAGAVDSYGMLHGTFDVRPLVCLAITNNLKALIVPREARCEPKDADPYEKVTVYYANTLEDARNILSTPSCREKYLRKN